MASISFDKDSGWWSIRYYAGPEKGRVKKNLAKHPPGWSKSKPPRKPLPEIRKLAERYEDLERRAKAGETIPQAAADLASHVRGYIDAYARTRRANSARNLRTAADRFLEFCAGRKVATVQAVTTRVCSDWIDSRLAEGAKPSTVRTERAFLATIFAKARRHRMITDNPWEFAAVEGTREEAPPKFWTEDELIKLIGVLDGWLRDWVILDANTGLRVSALLGLRWGDVDFRGNRLTVPPHLSKSGRSYSVPLTPSANEVLARRWSEAVDTRPEAPVFPSPRGGTYKRNTVAHRIARAVKKAGIRDFGSYCHSIRHSFAVALVNADVSIRVIQALLGHATIRTTEIYARLAPGKAEKIMGGFDLSPDRPPGPPGDPGPGNPSPPASGPS